MAEVIASNDAWLTLEVKNRFDVCSRVELITPGGNQKFTLEIITDLKGREMDSAPGSGHTVRIPRPPKSPLTVDGGYALLTLCC